MPSPNHGTPQRPRHHANTSRPSTRRTRDDMSRPATRRPRRAQARTEARSVPATVWALTDHHPVDPTAAWPAPIIAQLLDSCTQPDDHVILLPVPGSPQHQQTTAAGGDLATCEDTIGSHGRHARTVLLDPPAEPTAPAARPFWAHALDDTPTPDAGGGEPHTPAPNDHGQDLPAGADLVLTQLAPDAASGAVVDHLAGSAAHLLRTGGLLAVLTHSDQHGGVLRDPTGPMVAAAQNADLLYLQHLVVLLTPIREGHLTPPPEPVGADIPAPAGERPVAHQRIHTDLLLFTQPHAGDTDGGGTHAEARAQTHP